MTFALSRLSLSRLERVHPTLILIVQRAIAITTRDFMVVQGARTVEEAYVNFGKGRTAAQCVRAGCPASYAKPGADKVTWLKRPLGSKHLIQADGFGHAVDLAPWPYDPNDEDEPGYRAIAAAMNSAANSLQVPIVWGGTWVKRDKPHFELGVRS